MEPKLVDKFKVQPDQHQYATLSINRAETYDTAPEMRVQLIMQDGRVICGHLTLEGMMKALTGEKVLCNIIRDKPSDP